MQVKILSQEKNTARLEISVPGPVLKKALDEAYKVYRESHEDFSLPRDQVASAQEGQPILRQAVQDVFSDIYAEAIRSSGLQVASEPLISVLKADEEEGVIFHMEFALRPEVKLGTYKGIHVKCPPTEPTEEELEAVISQAEKEAAESGETLSDEEKYRIRQYVFEQKKQQADMQIEDQVLGRILEEAQVEIPEAMLRSEVNICFQQFVADLIAQGTDLETFSKKAGKTTEEMQKEMEPLANRRIMLRLVLSAIAKEENMEASEEEVEQYWAQMAQQYGMETEQMKAYAGDGAEAQVKADIVSSKAYALLRESTILDME